MRILHVLDHSIPMQSGYAFRTRAILREQRRMGWETFHLTSPKHTAPSEPIEEVDGLSFYRTCWKPGLFAHAPIAREIALMGATRRRLAEVARAVRPDILHVHSPVLNVIPALSVGRHLKIPVVYEVRAFWEDAAVDHGTSRHQGPRYMATRALETFALRRASHVTTICDGLRQDIVARGIPEGKVTVIPNAVDIDAFEFGVAPDLSLKSDLGLANCIIVGFIGSFYAYEGLDLLLAALPNALQRMPRLRVLLVGGGPEEAALKAMARRLGVEAKVVFAGRVPHQEVHRYYSIVDVFAFPRHSIRLTELVTPLKPLEAMAQGRLLIASDVGGHKELIRDGETGVLFRADDVASLTDAIVRLLSEPDRWPDLLKQGRAFVERERTWAASVARYRPIVDSLVPAAA
ncbi:MAG TPA: TIGR04063 family PEP-CTERM/XrtA system glycosyltransferase [Casimicrobiaceae bacterium]